MIIKELQPINYEVLYLKKETLKEFHLESLAPKQSDSDTAYYSKIINAGIQDSSVKNIAITGSYGAGKSSVLKIFQNNFGKKYKYFEKYKYLNISLANFRSDKETANTQSKVRLSILQQMFYHAHVRKIPDSRFKRIKSFSFWHTIFAGAILVLFLNSFFALFKPNTLYNLPLINSLAIYLESNYWLYWVVVNWGIFLTALYYFGKKLYHAKFGIHSIKLNSNGLFEVNGAKKEPHLILNEHLDEILYLFERKKFNVVIIEDLDRFADIAIFEELRELNFLINNAKQLKKRKVTFIYALNDSLFELINKRAEKEDNNIKKSLNIEQDENVSITSVENTDNSKQDCKPKLEFSTSIKHKTKFFDLIIPIIPFINITNSYNFLKKRNSSHLSPAFLSKMSFYIDDMRLLTNIMNEYEIYLNQIITQNNNSLNLDHNQLFSIILIKNFFPEEFDNLHLQESVISQVFGQLKYEFIDNKLIELKALQKDSNDESIEITIGLLSSSVSLHTLIQEFKDEINFLTHNPLVDYLIESGYLTEQYYYYISLLHKDALSINDHLFVKQFLPNEKNLEPDFKLNNPKDVYARLLLDAKDFESDKIFNCDLIHYLILNKEKNIEGELYKLIKISQQVEKFPLTAKKMIDIYFKNEDKYKDSISYFTDIVCRQWETIWEFVESKNSDAENILYARNILQHTKGRPLEKFKKNKSAFIQYIELMKNYYRVFKDIEVKRLENIIEILNIKFHHIDSSISEKQIDFLLDGQYYQITFYNILIILYKKKKYSGRINLKKNAYSIVKDSQIKPLVDYINKNLDAFINCVFCSDHPQYLIEENEDIIIEILNADNVQQATKMLLIPYLKNQLFNLDIINDEEIWETILKNNRIITSWKNIIVYFKKFGIDETLKNYLKQDNIQKQLETQLTEDSNFINYYVFEQLPISGIIYSLSNSENCLLSIMNDEDIEDDIKIEIIQKIENKNLITNIEDINDKSLWEYVFVENLISAKLINVIVYYQEQGKELDHALISYLNIQENYENLQKDLLSDYPEVNQIQLYSQFLSKNSISITAYQALLNIFGSHHFGDLELEIDDNTNPKKIAIAINRNLITLSPHNYNYLRTFNLQYYLVRKSYSDFINNLDDYDNVDKEDLNVLLNFTFEPADELDSKITLLIKNKNETANFINEYGLRSLIKFNLLNDESLVTDLLNNKNVHSSKTTELINELSIKIKDISAITNVAIQTSLFEHNKVLVSWENIYHYYINCDKEINQSLVEFLNIEENTRELVKLKIDYSKLSEVKQDVVDFQAKILYKDNIRDDIYFILADALSIWTCINLPSISGNKVNYLINQKILCLTDFNFKHLKEKFPNKHINLLEIHADLFLEFNVTDILDLIKIMTGNDYVLLLNSNRFKLDDKFKIIEKIPEKVIRSDDNLSKKLLSIFKSKRKCDYSIDLLIKVFAGMGNEDNKIDLIIKNLPRLNKTELNELLMTIPNLEKIGRCATATINFNKKYNSFFDELLKNKYLRKLIVVENKIKGKKQKQFKVTKN